MLFILRLHLQGCLLCHNYPLEANYSCHTNAHNELSPLLTMMHPCIVSLCTTTTYITYPHIVVARTMSPCILTTDIVPPSMMTTHTKPTYGIAPIHTKMLNPYSSGTNILSDKYTNEEITTTTTIAMSLQLLVLSKGVHMLPFLETHPKGSYNTNLDLRHSSKHPSLNI